MPKILSGSLAGHRAAVRQRLFGAMSALLAERGYDAITLADVAETAGVGRTSVYNHFPDKESVLLGLAEFETEQYLERLDAALADAADPAAALRVFIGEQLGALSGQHSNLIGLAGVLSEEGRRDIGQHVAPLFERLRGIIAQCIEHGYIPRPPGGADGADGDGADGDDDLGLTVLVRLVSASASGRITQGVPEEDLPRVIDDATRFVLAGLGMSVDADRQAVADR